MNIQESNNIEDISKVYFHKDNREDIGKTTEEELQILVDTKEYKFLLVKENSDILGMFCINRIYDDIYRAHINMLPEGRKEKAFEAEKLFEGWMKENSKCKTLQVVIPIEAMHAYIYAVNCGFKVKKVINNNYVLYKEIM